MKTSTAGFLRTQIGRGLLLLLVLLLVAVPSLAVLFPRHENPASAPSDQFSGERALAHLPVIAAEPHPTGSPAQERVREYLVSQLSNMGLEVEEQKQGSLVNVIARLRGSAPTGAVVILTHYDTTSSTPGAGDNGAAVAALLEIMRALAAGPVPVNDVIALFDDCEEIGPFTGTRAFVRAHPFMKDIKVAVSIDGAIAGFISLNEAGPTNNGWLVDVLSEAYTGGVWMSMSGGGIYNSVPFVEKGIPVITLEDGYPFRQYHTSEDLPGIIQPGTVQQLGEQTLSVSRVLAQWDLSNPWGEQETYFPVPILKLFVHYPQAWCFPLAIASGSLLLLAIGLTLWRKMTTWKGLGVAIGVILATTALSVVAVSQIQPHLPQIFHWQTNLWADWPEVIPPRGWLAAGLLGLFVFFLCLGAYILFRKWCRRADFSLAGMLPITMAAVIVSIAEPRAAYNFTWSAITASLAWLAASCLGERLGSWTLDAPTLVTGIPVIVFFIPALPGIIMSDGMKSLNILAGVEALALGVLFPVLDGLFVYPRRILTKKY